MACNLLGVGFLKLYKWIEVDGKKVKDTNSYRFIDVIPSLGIRDEVIQPYFFIYDYPQYKNTFSYSMSVEQMNTDSTISRIRSIAPEMSKNQVLELSAAFLPQNKVGDATLTDVASSTHTINKNESQGSIYAMILEGEMFLEIYTTSLDPNDPYGISDSNNVESLKGLVTLDMEDYIRSLVIGISQDLTKIDYNDPIISLATKPIKWLVDNSENNYARVPSARSMEEGNNIIDYSNIGLRIGSRIIADPLPKNLYLTPYKIGINDPIDNITDTF